MNISGDAIGLRGVVEKITQVSCDIVTFKHFLHVSTCASGQPSLHEGRSGEGEDKT